MRLRAASPSAHLPTALASVRRTRAAWQRQLSVRALRPASGCRSATALTNPRPRGCPASHGTRSGCRRGCGQPCPPPKPGLQGGGRLLPNRSRRGGAAPRACERRGEGWNVIGFVAHLQPRAWSTPAEAHHVQESRQGWTVLCCCAAECRHRRGRGAAFPRRVAGRSSRLRPHLAVEELP